jgi:hypothetical protein
MGIVVSIKKKKKIDKKKDDTKAAHEFVGSNPLCLFLTILEIQY